MNLFNSCLLHLASDTKISKYPRQVSVDETIGEGLKYTYIKDGEVFKTDGASLR